MSSNSTISTDEFVPGRKLVVHLAQNGHTMEFECGGSTPVDSIQRNIESLSGVPFADQLLMCGKVYLDPQQPLAYYKLPQDNREVFVYNKARLLENSPQPPPESVEVPNAVVPPLFSRCNNPRRFDDVSDPALGALGSYERKFRYHYNFADAFHRCTTAKYVLCNRLLREQQVQERALETVRGNLEFAFKKQQQRYSEFIRCFTEQHRVHAEILANLGRDMDRLRSLRLHPAVQSERRKCLLDLVKEDELIKWAEVCVNSHKQFENKVSQLKMNFGELKRKVDSVFSVMSSASSKDLEALIKDHQKFLNEQELIKITLSKDVNTVVKLVNDSVNHQLSSSLRPHDAVSGLGPIYEAHEKNCLPKVQNCDNFISKLLDTCKEKKNNMNLLVHVSMQKVKSTQISIKDLMNKLHAFEEAVGHQEKEFEHLKFVNGVGHAYRACLAEVIRRKSSSKLYMGLAGQLQERLATEREAEIRRRDGFYKAWSKYIPHDILATMGLLDSPNQCDVNMVTQFDKNLLEIDVADVDRYAPQAVVGLPLKSDKKKLTKSNLATSSESCNFNKSEESGPDTNIKDDFDGLFEGCESIDIAGTSKIEVENARLKAELASAIVFICTFNAGIGFDPFEKCEPDEMLKDIKEKTAEALQSKDEYVKHLQSILNRKQELCSAYEKRIQELEQRLEDQYAQGQKFSAKDASESVLSAFKADGYGESNNPCMSSVSMDEGSSTSALDPKLDLLTGETAKTGESGDENMTDIPGILNMQSLDPARNFMDASMQETPRDEQQVSDTENNQVGHQNKNLLEDVNREVKMTNVTHSSGSVTGDALGILPSGVEPELSLDSETRGSLVFNLQNALADKSNQFNETENQLKAAMKEISSLRKELDESQINCAHLENCLHEAREEARTNLCAADRRASEYSALRTTAVRMHSLFERFRSCVTAQVGVANFADTLRSLALSLTSSISEDEDDGTAEFRLSIKVLSDKVTFLSHHRSELIERCSRAEAELEKKTEQVNSLYTKLRNEKQASNKKISFVHLEVHELACFVRNSAGHYAAIHRNSSNYYLSSESVALFTEQYSGKPTYIIGQIVHIERRFVRLPTSPRTDSDALSSESSSNRLSPVSCDVSNPYGLPGGCEYFIVTVAMLPDTIGSSPS